MKELFSALLKSGGNITIDGKSFDVNSSVTISNGGRVIIDGAEQEGSLIGPVSITLNGDVDRLNTTSGRVEVAGSCGSINTMSGDVDCGSVAGDVSTMSGDVTCGAVSGRVKTMSGDIRHR